MREFPDDPARVAILDGAEGGRRIQVTGRITLGRGDDAELRIDDPEISRAHAVLAPTADGLAECLFIGFNMLAAPARTTKASQPAIAARRC